MSYTSCLEKFHAPPGAWGLAISTVRAMARVIPDRLYTVSSVADLLYEPGSPGHERTTRSIRRLLEGFTPVIPHTGNQGAVYSGAQFLEALDQDLSKQEVRDGVLGLNRARGIMAEEIVRLLEALPGGKEDLDLEDLFDQLRIARYAQIDEFRLALIKGKPHPQADLVRGATTKARVKALAATWGMPRSNSVPSLLSQPSSFEPSVNLPNHSFIGRLKQWGQMVMTGSRNHMRRFAWIHLAVLAFGSVGALATRPHLYDIMANAGPRAALQYVVNIEDGLKAYYHSAWVHYRDGRYQAAAEMAHRIINQKPNAQLMGNCLLLLGRVQVETGHPHLARTFFQSAIEAYPAKSKAYAELEIAWLDFNQGNIGTARQSLEALDLPSGYKEGMLYLVYLYQEPEKAASLARTMLSAASSTEERANWSSNLGCALIITGQLEDGYAFTLEAESHWVSMGYARGYTFNLINRLLYHRFHGLPSDHLQREIERWTERHGDTELQQLLNWSLNYPVPPFS